MGAGRTTPYEQDETDTVRESLPGTERGETWRCRVRRLKVTSLLRTDTRSPQSNDSLELKYQLISDLLVVASSLCDLQRVRQVDLLVTIFFFLPPTRF